MSNLLLPGPLNLWSLLLLLSCSLATGLFIFTIYKRTYGGMQYSRQYNMSHIFVILVTAFLIRVVSSSIYLALGMVGAVSIVRFRLAVKDSIEVVFMLWAIVAGIMLAAGGNFILYALLCSVFIGAMLLILKSVRTKDRYSYMLIIRHEMRCAGEVNYALKKLPRNAHLKSKTVTKDTVEITMELRLPDENAVSLLDFQRIDGVYDSTLVCLLDDF